jgi:hypothetical protein
MKCNRLIVLVKNWYLQVQDEAMAPARMVEFMTKHIATCEVCAEDPDVRAEAKKIRDIVLPASKVPKLAESVDGRNQTPHDEEPPTPQDEEYAGDIEPDENSVSDAV